MLYSLFHTGKVPVKYWCDSNLNQAEHAERETAPRSFRKTNLKKTELLAAQIALVSGHKAQSLKTI